ncbi:histone-like nucleoid-structuring protein Lsr2 [Streptomyces antarcticus]|uniref:histone-like nucleoid-structuring protein Lsr2 n=1 Tax=Streptomyces antarcticus TaxID=2996458 RepID=UPI0022712462|nr:MULTISPECIES: Lsr2 family protein [unclassified Streptomyces]MCY0941922.1 Lsr2 family protein [Streptomyces sp. H34-AA3]MCZ4082805.1 Lsr2 family protein [Streptomyces sp. H34-S5]
MAQKVQILLVDDIDGGQADETLTFALDGKTYEIDLSTEKAEKLRKALEPFVKGGRRKGSQAASAGSRGRSSAAASPDGPSAEELRTWAAKNGYEVKDRGRVPVSIREAYMAAHA